jgi:hypothetical protein
MITCFELLKKHIVETGVQRFGLAHGLQGCGFYFGGGFRGFVPGRRGLLSTGTRTKGNYGRQH